MKPELIEMVVFGCKAWVFIDRMSISPHAGGFIIKNAGTPFGEICRAAAAAAASTHSAHFKCKFFEANEESRMFEADTNASLAGRKNLSYSQAKKSLNKRCPPTHIPPPRPACAGRSGPDLSSAQPTPLTSRS
jgi:hypothetical protein